MIEDRVRVMFRIPDNICRSIDAYAGYSHASRPDVIIDACRQFRLAIFLSEKTLLDALDEQDAIKEVKTAFFYQEMSKFVDGFKEDYRRSLSKTKEDVSILVTFPPMLLADINEYIKRSNLFKNIHDYVKAALMYFFTVQVDRNKHEKRMQDFTNTDDIAEKVEKLREMMKNENK
ncbi:MAG: hypothetical protein IJT54_07685 [Candidatus Methanomethylophilaceae archaeon]|nr:hypothetical protein [Candidatus Methanomethylophilaceae archaeon]